MKITFALLLIVTVMAGGVAAQQQPQRIAGIVVGVLNSYGHFTVPALTAADDWLRELGKGLR